MTPIEFEVHHRYQDSDAGILIPVELALANARVRLNARVDTGASDCLFPRHYAELLGIDLEAGVHRTYRTLMGSVRAYGHEVSVSTLGLEWSATVFFYEATDAANSFVGRRGFADRLRLGLVHYDHDLYLAPHDR